VAGRNDDFIGPHHSQQIYDAYAGDKNLILVEGDHNSIRPRFMFDSVSIFLQQTLQVRHEAPAYRCDEQHSRSRRPWPRRAIP
jgi:PhoPQ-activated pathogenicity-related protein